MLSRPISHLPRCIWSVLRGKLWCLSISALRADIYIQTLQILMKSSSQSGALYPCPVSPQCWHRAATPPWQHMAQSDSAWPTLAWWWAAGGTLSNTRHQSHMDWPSPGCQPHQHHQNLHQFSDHRLSVVRSMYVLVQVLSLCSHCCWRMKEWKMIIELILSIIPR